MGTSTIPVTTGTTRALHADYIQNLRGRLKAVSAFVIETSCHDARIFCQVGTMMGGRGSEFRQNILAHGYIGSTTGINWTGDVPIQETEEVYIWLWPSSAQTVLLRIETED